MNISVFGLGYVGFVCSGCLAKEGHNVISVDVDQVKVDAVKNGKSPIIEEGTADLIQEVVKSEKLRATNDPYEAIQSSDISLICVGTPSQENGELNLCYIRKVCNEIGSALKVKNQYHLIVIRSTVLPGTTYKFIPILEKKSNKSIGKDFGLCVNPEFLREGTSIKDFYNPPKTLIGEYDKKSGDILEKLYTEMNLNKAPIIRTDIRSAEIIKYVDNSFHALKVAFANEIGNICKRFGIDSHEVMRIFCMDTKLNISPYYLKPGFAFGGSCLPKDLRALIYSGKKMDMELPLLSSILPSNENQVRIAFDLIKKTRKKKIGVLGLSFKQGTDDLRESPSVSLIEMLIGKGFCVKIYDKEVSLARIFGANKRYIERVIPHISSLMCNSLQELLDHSDLLVVANNSPEFKKVLNEIKGNKKIIDLVRIIDKYNDMDGYYNGICW